MLPEKPLSLRQQTLNTLRDGIRNRRWAGVLPGVRPLAAQLGVSTGTVQSALRALAEEGLIDHKGSGVCRSVGTGATAVASPRTLRVGIVTDEPMSAESALNLVNLHGIVHALEEDGHRAFFAPKAMQALRHDTASIRMMMTECAADAWVVVSAGRPLLESLSADFPTPVLALGGAVDGLDVAAVGVRIGNTIRECVRRLAALGHERIVLALPPWDRNPVLSPRVCIFNEELAAAGIKPGRYHVPDWDQTGDGFNALLRSLFTLTPPTALIVDDVRQVCVVHAFLAARRIPPRDLALIFLGFDPALDWISPAPIHLSYDNAAQVRRISDWVATLAAGGRDTAQVRVEPELVGLFTPPPRA